DPDRCPNCQHVTYARRQQWDGQRWRRATLSSATCSECGTTWELAPIADAEPHMPVQADDLVPDAARPLRVAIVGSRSLAGHVGAVRVVRKVLDDYQARHSHFVVISGAAPGIDRMAAAEARRRGLTVVERLPATYDWPGFRERDRLIAADCDEL